MAGVAGRFVTPGGIGPFVDRLNAGGARPCSTSLEAYETSVDIGPNTVASYCQHVGQFGNCFEYLHDRYKFARAKLLKVLTYAPDQTLNKLAGRIADCGSWPCIYADEDDNIQIGSSFCKARICPLCSDRRARKIEMRVHAIVQKWQDLRHLTLTPRSTSSSLKESLDKLIKDFRNLRQRPVWKQHVRGGVATVEVTYNVKTHLWHPHLHVLLDGDYFPHKAIADTWQSVTGDSNVVWIKRFIKKSRAARYVTKYIAKPGDFLKWPDNRLAEFVKALTGRRVLITFGTSYRDLRGGIDVKHNKHTYNWISSLYTIRRAVIEDKPWGRDWIATANEVQPKLLQLLLRAIPFHVAIPPPPAAATNRDLINLSRDCDSAHMDNEIPIRYRMTLQTHQQLTMKYA